MIDPAAFVSPIRLVLRAIKVQRKARARARTHLNTSFRRRPKFNGDFQLLVLLVTSLALIPTIWWFSCEAHAGAQAVQASRPVHFAEPSIYAGVVAPNLGATLKTLVARVRQRNRFVRAVNYRPSLIEQEAGLESNGIVQEVSIELDFNPANFADAGNTQLVAFWSEDCLCDWQSKQGRSILYGLELGSYLLAGLACMGFKFHLHIKATRNRLKLYSQFKLSRYAVKHRVFQTRSLLTNRHRWRGWHVDSRWLS